jgi:hypothetical protein
MPRFRLSADVTVSAFTIVEADTLEAAIAIAEDRAAVIGGIGTGEDENENWIIEEADGLPKNIHTI